MKRIRIKSFQDQWADDTGDRAGKWESTRRKKQNRREDMEGRKAMGRNDEDDEVITNVYMFALWQINLHFIVLGGRWPVIVIISQMRKSKHREGLSHVPWLGHTASELYSLDLNLRSLVPPSVHLTCRLLQLSQWVSQLREEGRCGRNTQVYEIQVKMAQVELSVKE